MSEAPQIGSWKDADGRLTVSVPCRTCGYDLRTLRTDGLCPECGTPVAASARPDDLRLADVPRLDRVSRWLNLTTWALALLAALPACFLLSVLTGLVAGVMAVLVRWGGTPARLIWAAVLILSIPATLATLIGVVLVFASLWRLARVSFDPILRRRVPAARRRLLIAVPVALAAVPVAMRTGPPVNLGVALIGLGALTSCVVPLAYALTDLWDSLHESTRSRQARQHRSSLSIGGGLLVLSGLYAVAAGWSRLRGSLAEAMPVVLSLTTFFATVGICGAVVRLALDARRLRSFCRQIRATREAAGEADA